MMVFEFESSSLKDVDHIAHLANIIASYAEEEKLLLVLPAMPGVATTLKNVVTHFYNEQNKYALQIFESVKKQHLEAAKYLLVLNYNTCIAKLSDLFTEAEWLLHDKPVKSYNYYYDQVVSIGALLSSTIISAYLAEKNLDNTLLDIRDVIRTDHNFMQANIDEKVTGINAQKLIQPILLSKKIVVTQNATGCTDENESTTFGAALTAATLASALDIKVVIAWKEHKGWMNMNPAKYNSAKVMSHLSYAQARLLSKFDHTYASPAAISILEKKHITLYIKHFYDTGLPGTLVSNPQEEVLPPIITEANAVTLLTIVRASHTTAAPDDKMIQDISYALQSNNLQPLLLEIKNSQVYLVPDASQDVVATFAQAISSDFDVQVQKDISIICFINSDEAHVANILAGKKIIFSHIAGEAILVLVE